MWKRCVEKMIKIWMENQGNSNKTKTDEGQEMHVIPRPKYLFPVCACIAISHKEHQRPICPEGMDLSGDFWHIEAIDELYIDTLPQ